MYFIHDRTIARISEATTNGYTAENSRNEKKKKERRRVKRTWQVCINGLRLACGKAS